LRQLLCSREESAVVAAEKLGLPFISEEKFLLMMNDAGARS
jgi:hypothetical protein